MCAVPVLGLQFHSHHKESALARVVVSRQQIIFQNAGDLLGCLELLFDDDEACSHPNQLSHLSASHPFLLPPSIQPTLYRLPPPLSPPLPSSLSLTLSFRPDPPVRPPRQSGGGREKSRGAGGWNLSVSFSRGPMRRFVWIRQSSEVVSELVVDLL